MSTVIVQSALQHAHHEAGHAVATVHRGGELVDVYLGTVDWSTDDESADSGGGTRHRTPYEHQPFVTFAGPWASAMWLVRNDPDVDDLDEALECAWNDADDDGEKYSARVLQLQQAAAQLGFHVWHPTWESDWCDELQDLWPAVQQVATLLIDGKDVDHDLVAEFLRGLPEFS